MENTLMKFDYQQHEIRTAMREDGEIWFVAKDVCEALDIKWAGDQANLARISDKWKQGMEIPDPNGRIQMTTCINEAAVYKLAFRSHKPAAEAFTDWVAGDVLPTLRKTGHYTLPADFVEKMAHWTDMDRKMRKWEEFDTVGRMAIPALQDVIDYQQREMETLRTENHILRQEKRGSA